MINKKNTSKATSLQASASYEEGPTVKVLPDGELMTNYQAYLPVAPGNAIGAVQDPDGNPLIFSIGSDGQLYLIGRDTEEFTGWNQLSLTSALGDVTATAFQAVQAENGNVYVAVAISQPSDLTQSTLYITGAMPNTITDSAWQGMGTQWIERDAMVSSGTGGTNPPDDLGTPSIESILIGESGTTGIPAIIVAAEVNGATQHYLVNGDTTNNDWSWKTYPKPSDTASISSMAMGKTSLGYGVFVLGPNLSGTDLTLSFTTFVNQYGSTYNAIYQAPEGAVSLQVIADPNHYNYAQIFVAGSNGLSWFPSTANGGNDPSVPIFGSAETGNIRQLQVRQTANDIAIWYDNTQEDLFFVQGPQASDAASAVWTAPLALRSQVTQIAAFNNMSENGGNALCFVTGSSTLGVMYQDRENSVWNEMDIPLQDNGEVQSFTTYTSQAQFTTERGLPLAGRPVQVSASQTTYCTVNGNLYGLSPNERITVNLDPQGMISFMQKVSDISTPIYTVTADFLEADYVLNPADKVLAGLAGIQSGDDLKNATNQDGTPVITGDYPNQLYDYGAYSVDQLNQMIAALPADGANQESSGAQAKTKSHNPKLEQRWGMYLGGDSPMLYKGDEVATHLLPALGYNQRSTVLNLGVIDFAESLIGDVLQALETGLEKVAGFFLNIVEDVFEFIVKIGAKIFKVVIKCIVQAVKIAAWILDELFDIDLLGFLQWLGFIFDWGDIVTTHKVIANVANQSMNMVKANVEGAEDKIRSFFGTLRRQLKGMPDLPDQVAGTSLASIIEKMQGSVPPDQQDSYDFIAGSSGGNFANYQAQYSGMLTADPLNGDTDEGPIMTFIDDILIPVMKEAAGLLKTMAEDFKTIIQGFINGTMTLGQAIELLVSDTLIALIDLCEILMIGLLEIANSLITTFQDMINANIQVPFLTAFFKLLTGDDEMSILNGISLLMAAPATVFFKLVSGNAPFDEDAFGLIDGDWQQVFSTLTGNTSQAKQVQRSSRASTDEATQAQKIYTEVGGITGLSADMFSAILDAINSLTKSEIKFADEMQIVSALVSTASSFPVDENKTKLDIEYGVWALGTFDILIDVIELLAPRAAKPELGMFVTGPYKLLSTTIDIACDIAVFIIGCIDDSGEDLAWDIEGFVQDIASAAAGYASGISKIDPDPVTEAVEQTVAVLCTLDAVALGAIRDIADIVDNEVYAY